MKTVLPSIHFVHLTDIIKPEIHKNNIGVNVCAQGEKYIIDEGVFLVATPGHTATDVSLIVHNTTYGTVLLAGKI